AQVLIERLGGRPWAEDFYLAGSAALTLYLGHRPIADLDLMSNANRLAPSERRDLLADLLALDPACEGETARDGYLYARAGGARPPSPGGPACGGPGGLAGARAARPRLKEPRPHHRRGPPPRLRRPLPPLPAPAARRSPGPGRGQVRARARLPAASLQGAGRP